MSNPSRGVTINVALATRNSWFQSRLQFTMYDGDTLRDVSRSQITAR